MSKFRKKPVVIEAFRYTGDLYTNGEFNCPDWAVEAYENGTFVSHGQGELYIKTLEGEMLVSVGDYIIQGVNGELYPCKPDIFRKTYDSTETTVLGRMEKELKDVRIKVGTLGIFTGKPEFFKLSNAQQELMIEQLGYMEKYHNTLEKRIKLYKEENK